MREIYITSCLLLSLTMACSDDKQLQGHLLFEQGKYKESIKVYNQYLGENPSNIEVIYNQGRAYQELANLNQAKHNFEKVLKLDPKHQLAYISLAQVAYSRKNYQRSSFYIQKAIDLNFTSADAHFMLGRSLHHLGFFDQALEAYNDCLTANKSFGKAYLYRGAIKVSRKQLRSACEDFKNAEQLDVAEAKSVFQEYCN